MLRFANNLRVTVGYGGTTCSGLGRAGTTALDANLRSRQAMTGGPANGLQTV